MKGISKKTVEEHLKLYAGYVNKYNEITDRIKALTDDDFSKANQVFSTIRSLKTELSFAWGGVINHEIYFTHLGGDGGTASSKLLHQIEKDFGSFEAYKKDMKASAISARGWVWTLWHPAESRLINHIGDSQNTYGFWGATPLVALDTYEHAYFADYGVNRGQYVDSFFENVNWEIIEEAFERLKI
ncbi:MAG: superoxide dismutase [Candidatus Roizmanbacteria bacterium]|nr:superoxide dismutase [Candidatus Roizmanbacteria bacterium]